MKRVLIFISLFSMLLVVSCGKHGEESNVVSSDASDTNFVELLDIPLTEQPPPPPLPPTSEDIQQVEISTRKLIKSGDIQIQTDNIKNDYKKILKFDSTT
ncbi:hypothetical protein MM239_13335 [Belliella sp. DSM 111904]|uniref:Uncharacterized protein n=1 Tax=Belliella filtrata TaxID=2923435 RepID=A0ABS9V1T7_9BACT|nr:hypothetical protein [Belliella filtrata]MCH7410384.1 hypothetical protein [Belliella filtrata]